MMTSFKVFVYGTLKRGEPNHHWITDPINGKAAFLGTGKTLTKYPLVIGTRYNIPFLIYEPGNGHNVFGEIYEVDEPMLKRLDVLEDHPNFYERQMEVIQCITSDFNVGTESMNCWVYFLKRFRPELLKLSMLMCYNSNGDHGLSYCERYLRDPSYSFHEEVCQDYSRPPK